MKENENKKADPLGQVDKELLKSIYKEALSEWLDKQKQETYQSIGKWILSAIAVAVVTAGMYLMYWVENHRI